MYFQYNYVCFFLKGAIGVFLDNLTKINMSSN